MATTLLSCPLCLKPHFDGVDALRMSLINAATTSISCPVCSELFLGLDKLTIHLFSHISAKLQEAQIYEAPQSEYPPEVIEEPADIEMKEDVMCDICSCRFTEESMLDMHQKLLHETSPDKTTGKYNYHCHLCSKQFKMRGSLIVHLRVAHFGFVQSNRLNVPNDMEKVFQKSSRYHGRSIGSKMENKQWECDVCYKMFTTKYFLKKHKRLHTGEMPYYCAQCNKYFTFQQSYHKHMLYHSDEKPHTCTECGRAFKELSTLHNHERIHSGERPFKCETCDKSFRQRVSYLVHRRIHTGVMPYKCTACSKSFRYKVSQRSHKCPVIPPGCVVRIPDVVETIPKDEEIIGHSKHDSQLFQPPKEPQETIKSRDKPIASEQPIDAFIKVASKDENPTHFPTEVNINMNTTPDFFSMVLSPVLCDVQSLCLSNYTVQDGIRTEILEKRKDLETINEESFKELLYGLDNPK